MAPRSDDPTEAIRNAAAAFPDVLKGTACTQSAFKTKKGAFLYIGPGAKGQGFKAMFKLDRSRPQAAKLAAQHPDRFELGSGAWVAARFTAEAPLAKSIWSKWLKESHGLTSGSSASTKAKARTRSTKKARTRKA